jgi:hypothetical protein
MVYQRHGDGFLVFPVGGIGFNLQDLHFYPTSIVAFLVRMLNKNRNTIIVHLNVT